jgi:protease-4
MGLGTVEWGKAEPNAMAKATTTRPGAATTRAAGVSAAEDLARKLKQLKDQKAAMGKVAHIDLSRPLPEKPADFSLFGDVGVQTQYSVLSRIAQAGKDKNIAALLVTAREEELGLAQAEELRDALGAVSAAGKPVFVYADRFSTATYTMATGATDVCILPGGEMMMPGVAIETMFAKGLLDKIGVKAEMIQIGEYKGADESMTRYNASDELRGELNRLVDGMYGQVVKDIAQRRHLAEKVVEGAIDRAMIPAADAKELKLVDHVVDIDGLRELMRQKVGKDIDIQTEYGVARRDEIDMSNPFALFHMLAKRPTVSEEPAVGLVYVDGMIAEGDGDGGLFQDSLATDGAIRKAMRLALRDASIKAVLIRIDSPGGSALASEAAWQAIRRVAKEKPVVVSVGGMAASGGYYIACAGDRIYADPAAIIGSIGVVGGKLSLQELYAKIGLSSEIFSRGANAGMFSSSQPFTDAQRVLLKNLMKQTYEQFVDRVMQTRKDKIQAIDKVARGRIFVAQQAKDLGMIDEIGGMNAALRYTGEKAGLGATPKVRVLPAPKTLADLFAGTAEAKAPVQRMQMPVELTLLPEGARKLAMRELYVLQALQNEATLAVTPAMFQAK